MRRSHNSPKPDGAGAIIADPASFADVRTWLIKLRVPGRYAFLENFATPMSEAELPEGILRQDIIETLLDLR